MSEAAVRVRDERRSWACPGSSHDRVLGIARVALPAAIGALAALLAIAPLTSGKNISFVLAKDRVAVAPERMRVAQALYRGEDSRGRPFRISAGSAVQATSAVPVLRLNALAAQLALADGPAVLDAPAGRYDMNTQKLAIDGPVKLSSAGGYRLATRDVLVDLDRRTLSSQAPVDGEMPLGRFSADRLHADMDARTVVLSGRARLHIVQGQRRAAR